MLLFAHRSRNYCRILKVISTQTISTQSQTLNRLTHFDSNMRKMHTSCSAVNLVIKTQLFNLMIKWWNSLVCFRKCKFQLLHRQHRHLVFSCLIFQDLLLPVITNKWHFRHCDGLQKTTFDYNFLTKYLQNIEEAYSSDPTFKTNVLVSFSNTQTNI